MTALPPAVSELESRLGLPEGALEGPEKFRATAALDDAATLALAEAPPPVAERWKADTPKVVRLVALKAARREFENPRGIAQETQGEHTIGLSESSGVYLTARGIAQVRRSAFGRPKGFVGSIRTPSAYESSSSSLTTQDHGHSQSATAAFLAGIRCIPRRAATGGLGRSPSRRAPNRSVRY